MKKKLTKIWGIGLAVVLLVMLIGAAIPVSAATLAWSPVSTPNPITQQLQDDSDVDALAIAPDGTTMFAYDNTGTKLYKSTNAGKTWTGTGIGATLDGETVVGLAVSPDYATDATVVAATAIAVYRSINGGKSFGTVGTVTLVAGTDATSSQVITSVAISPYYLGGSAIMVGTRDADTGDFGNVQVFTTASLAWTVQTALSEDVVAVAFSPNHQADAQILALSTNETNTYLRTKFGTDAWNLGILAATIGTKQVATGGSIAFADDYEWSANNRVMVGIATGANDGDVYRVHGALPGGVSVAFDLNVDGSTTQSAPVSSLAVKGSIAEADVLVGQADTGTIKRCHDPTTSTVTWRSSTKSPTGEGNTVVAWSPTTGDAYVATTGDGSAFSRSTDGGVTWNGLALIDVSALADQTIVDSAIVDSNTMYIIMADPVDKESLFKTTDGGSTWERVWYYQGLAILALSPNYATDETLFVAQGDTRLWKSTNGGETFIGLTAPAAITAIGVVDKDTYYTGHDAAVYKSGRWVAATGVSDTVKSFAIAADGTIFIGTNDGDVQMSTDDAAKFTTLGAAEQLGTLEDVIVVLDPNYATNSTIYAGSSDGSIGVSRWVVGTSTVWKELDDGATAGELTVSGLVLSADGSLYAASSTAGKGVRRSVSPTAPVAKVGFESVTTDLPSPTAVTLDNLAVVSGSNVLYAVASNIIPGGYQYGYRLLTITDVLAVSPALSAPKDGSVTPGTSVTLGWKAITSPVRLDYEYWVSTDSKFANLVSGTGLGETTTGTGITITGLSSGTKYYWKVRVQPADPLASKFSAVWTFTPQLSVTGTTALTTAPEPGATDVLLRPVFQWSSVPKAASYELELADNAFFANASVKKPLTHTVWTWDTDLEYSTTYYWRVRAVAKGLFGSWSEASFTTMAEPVVEPPLVIPPPTVTVQPTPVPPITIPPAPPSPITPAIIWAIIIIGAVLVIAVIVLIVRTRRVP